MFKPKNLYTALITPFDHNGNIDLVSLASLIQVQNESKVDGIVILGSTGEAATLSNEERDIVIAESRQLLSKDKKLIVGTGHNDTKEAIKLSEKAGKIGADKLMIISPFYNKPPQEGIYHHYTQISQHVDLPIFLYDAPSRTGSNIQIKTIERLAAIPNIIGLKDASGNLQRVTTLRDSLNDNSFSLLCGDDVNALAFNANGGDGCISVISNIMPNDCKEIQVLTEENNFQQAWLKHKIIAKIAEILAIDINPITIKLAAYYKGLIQNPQVRLPLYITDNTKNTIKNFFS